MKVTTLETGRLWIRATPETGHAVVAYIDPETRRWEYSVECGTERLMETAEYVVRTVEQRRPIQPAEEKLLAEFLAFLRGKQR